MIRHAPGVVLVYHRVVDVEPDPFSLAVAPDRFESHVDAVRRRATIVPLAEVGRRAEPTVAITFDDGYADTAEIAAPILRDRDAPSTLFVTTSALVGDDEFWWDRLGHLLLDRPPRCDAIVIDVPGCRLHVDVRTSDGARRAVKVLSHRLRRRPPEEIDAVLDDVAAQVGAEPAPCDLHRHVDAGQLTELARGALVEIGAHTHSHSMLTALPHERRRAELEEPRRTLAAVLGHPVASCAYPFGGREAYDAATARLARTVGYERACINEGGLVGRRTDPYRIPRHEVYDWPADEFASRLDGWFAA